MASYLAAITSTFTVFQRVKYDIKGDRSLLIGFQSNADTVEWRDNVVTDGADVN